eukprot:TRINITY_DN48624_c0_g1_i1.p1 TRINITY_DN48624_c0_g1~~TRINITY_DN48624_c0_g1_i1.p1  ORF type:complete len:234 (-),score=23.17 TRINITY_DN48624_c0_g1_i1:195-896(-)
MATTLRPFSAPIRSCSESSLTSRTRRPKSACHDWAEGWDTHPVKRAFPRYTIPQRSKGRAPYQAFRDSYLDEKARSCKHIPGPGAYRAPREILDERPVQTRSSSRCRRRRMPPPDDEGVGAERPAPAFDEEDGDQVDATRTKLSRGTSARIPRQARAASASCLSKVPRGCKMPSSFHTPGPGAYTQLTCFGQQSGGTSAKYLATGVGDIDQRARRVPDKGPVWSRPDKTALCA